MLGLAYSFRIKINYKDSFSAMFKIKLKSALNPWLKLFIPTLSGPRIKHILLTLKALCLRKFRQYIFCNYWIEKNQNALTPVFNDRIEMMVLKLL